MGALPSPIRARPTRDRCIPRGSIVAAMPMPITLKPNRIIWLSLNFMLINPLSALPIVIPIKYIPAKPAAISAGTPLWRVRELAAHSPVVCSRAQ